MARSLGPNFFSLTNILLTSSFLYALTSAAPVPIALDATKSFLTTHFDAFAAKPRYSPLDNLRIGTIVPGRSRVFPRTPAEDVVNVNPSPPASLPRKIVDRRGEMKYSHRSFRPTFETQESTPAPTKGPVSMRINRRQTQDSVLELVTRKSNERKSFQPIVTKDAHEDHLWKQASFDPRDPEAHSHIENSPVGATKLFTGKLWRKGLKRTPIV